MGIFQIFRTILIALPPPSWFPHYLLKNECDSLEHQMIAHEWRCQLNLLQVLIQRHAKTLLGICPQNGADKDRSMIMEPQNLSELPDH